MTWATFKAGCREGIDLIRELIHDATAPCADELRRDARQTLRVLAGGVVLMIVSVTVVVYAVRVLCEP